MNWTVYIQQFAVRKLILAFYGVRLKTTIFLLLLGLFLVQNSKIRTNAKPQKNNNKKNPFSIWIHFLVMNLSAHNNSSDYWTLRDSFC